MTYEQEQKLIEAIKKDAQHIKLLAACEQLEPEYERIAGSIPERDREILEKYISLCEELEYRRTCIALNMEK